MGQLEDSLIGLSDPIDIIRYLRNFTNGQSFIDYAESTAMKLVTSLFNDSGRTWRQAARHSPNGRIIYESLRKELKGPMGNAVRQQIQRNAGIIRSLPFDISTQVTEYVLKESMAGTRASDIADQIRVFFPEASRAQEKLIARTETSKTSTALTQAASEGMGVSWYVWRTSEDTRVRDSHREMDGVLIKWDNPPSPEALIHEKHVYGHYHAGEIFNCRCYCEPVIDMDLINWPARVYYQGVIQRMTRKQFESIM